MAVSPNRVQFKYRGWALRSTFPQSSREYPSGLHLITPEGRLEPLVRVRRTRQDARNEVGAQHATADMFPPDLGVGAQYATADLRPTDLGVGARVGAQAQTEVEAERGPESDPDAGVPAALLAPQGYTHP